MSQWRWYAAAAAALLGGCSDAPLGPTDVAGTYHATTFKAVINGVTTDLAALGATITLVLTADGHTSGHAVVPAAGGANPTAVDEDLAGTYHVGNGVVQISQATGGYLDGLLFTADPPELRGYISLQDATRTGQFTLILSRQ